jgi:hypothetical protein
MVACKPMWQNTRAYQKITNNPCPYINAEVLLVSSLSAITRKLNVSGHMLIWIFFLVLVCETRAQNLSAPFSYTLYTKDHGNRVRQSGNAKLIFKMTG